MNNDLNGRDFLFSQSEISDFHSNSSNEDSVSWPEQFVEKSGYNWLCVVSEDFLFDNFNMHGLSDLIQRYEESLAVIRDISSIDEIIDYHNLIQNVQDLYFLIHSRYILSENGLKKMREKYLEKVFGECPRKECGGQPVIATGSSNIPGRDSCCTYCPRCRDVYHTYSHNILSLDGSAFGISFGPLFFRVFQDLIPNSPIKLHSFQIMGFHLHKSRWRSVRRENEEIECK